MSEFLEKLKDLQKLPKEYLKIKVQYNKWE